jgi:hypothetical protein
MACGTLFARQGRRRKLKIAMKKAFSGEGQKKCCEFEGIQMCLGNGFVS